MKKSELKQLIKKCLLEEQASGNFETLLKSYMSELEDYHKKYYAKNLSNVPPPKFEQKRGGKFVKIIRVDQASKSAFCFVDYDGNIYKAAGWNAPAKGIRGTLGDKNKPLDGRDFYRR